MARERMTQPSLPTPEPAEAATGSVISGYDDKLRPTRLRDLIGQKKVVERIEVIVDAARKKKEKLDHILFKGPPGLGKTTLASVIPRELGVDFVITSGPALNSPKELMPYLTNLTERSVLFIDEIHRLPAAVEEYLYPAMEDYRIDIVLGEGLGARTLSMPLKPFTLIGATTRSGMLTGPLRDRFRIHETMEFYTDEELTQIVSINAAKLELNLVPEAAREIACRSRGTPRVANSLLCWVRSFAISKEQATVDLPIVRQALQMQEVDELGLNRQDRAYLDVLIRVFGGGPTGVDALAATMSYATDTLSEEVEPFLLRQELIIRTPRGRRATAKAYQHLNQRPPAGTQGELF